MLDTSVLSLQYLHMISRIKQLAQHPGVRKYTSNALWLIVGRIGSLGISYIATLFVVRSLGPSNNGLLAFSVSFVGLFSVIANLGIDQILFERITRDISKKNEILGTAIIIRAVSAIIAIVLILATAIATGNNRTSTLLIFINSWTILFGAPTLISYYFQARAEGKYQAFGQISATIILSSLKILAIYLHFGVFALAYILLLENIIYSIFWVSIYRKTGNKIRDLNFNSILARDLIANSAPLMLSSVAIAVYSRADQVLLKYLAGNSSVGIYDAAVRLSELWYFIPSLIITSLFPAIVYAHDHNPELFKQRMTRLYAILIYASVFIGLTMTLLANKIMYMLYGQAFMAGVPVLKIYAWACVPISLSITINTYLLLIKRNGLAFLSSLAGMVVNIALNLVLIPRYGLTGAATATIISYSLIPITPLLFPSIRHHTVLIKDAALLPMRLAQYTIKQYL